MREFEPVLSADPAPRARTERGRGVDALLGQAAAQGKVGALGPTGMLKLQREVGNAGASALMEHEEERSPVHDVVGSGGEPLSKDVRTDMESRLGHDFSDVRVHSDSAAHDSAQAVSARAYTVGSHVVFQRDAYDPGSPEGQHTLAHELAHVVQQRSGPVEGQDASGGIRVSDPGDRHEREAVQAADAAMAGQAPTVAGSGSAGVQREEEGAEEEASESPAVQTYVQRHESGEDESSQSPAVQSFVQREEEGAEEEASESPAVQTYVQREDEAPEEEMSESPAVQTHVQREEEGDEAEGEE